MRVTPTCQSLAIGFKELKILGVSLQPLYPDYDPVHEHLAALARMESLNLFGEILANPEVQARLSSVTLHDFVTASYFDEVVRFAPYLGQGPSHDVHQGLFEYKMLGIEPQLQKLISKYLPAAHKEDNETHYWFSWPEQLFVKPLRLKELGSIPAIGVFGGEMLDYECIGVIADHRAKEMYKFLKDTFDFGVARVRAATFTSDEFVVRLDKYVLGGFDQEFGPMHGSWSDAEEVAENLEDFQSSHEQDYIKYLRARPKSDSSTPKFEISDAVVEAFRALIAEKDDACLFDEESNSYFMDGATPMCVAEVGGKALAFYPEISNKPIGEIKGKGAKEVLKNIDDFPGAPLAWVTSFEVFLDAKKPYVQIFCGTKSPLNSLNA